MKKMIYSSLILIIFSSFIIGILTGANEPVPYDSPNIPIQVLKEKQNSKKHIPQINQLAKNKGNISVLDIESNKNSNEISKNSNALWIHSNALDKLNDQQINKIKQSMRNGMPVIFMSKEDKNFFAKFDIPEIETETKDGNTTIVGIGILYNGGTFNGIPVPEYTVISVPNDRLQTEGDKPAINAFVGATNKMNKNKKQQIN